MSREEYVHGYSDREEARLGDQASTLSELLHHDTLFPAGSRVLEAGCAVGATTAIVAKKNPDVRFVSVDVDADSLSKAADRLSRENVRNVELIRADVFDLPFSERSFDFAFACFVLEHLPSPVAALAALMTYVKPGGSVTAIEGDHGSVFFHPECAEARMAIRCQKTLLAAAGGNSDIGRELFPLFSKAGLERIRVSPRMVYADPGRPGLAEGFTRNTFTAMIEGVRAEALARNLISEADFDEGIRGLLRASGEDGVFCYTFFKCVGHVPRA